MKNKGLLVVVSGPSGAGKSTLLKSLLEMNRHHKLSISATTREKRSGEKEGEHYYFLSKDHFEGLIQKDQMLEYATYCDNLYGTPQEPVEKMLEMGYNVILEIEVDGAMQVKQRYKEAVMIFVMPTSFEELERRLVSRDTEDKEVIAKRLEMALKEMKRAVQYDYVVVNEDVETCVNEIDQIITVNKHTTKQMEDFIIEVIKNATTSYQSNHSRRG